MPSPAALSRKSRGQRASLYPQLLCRSDEGRSIVFNRGIVVSYSCRFGKGLDLAHDICSLRPNEANEVMHHALFVIRDLEKEGRDDLPDSCEVGVGQFPGDRLELLKGMG